MELNTLRRIIFLVHRYKDGIISAEEQIELNHWLNEREANRKLIDEVTDSYNQQQAIQIIHDFSKEERLRKILNIQQNKGKLFVSLGYKIAASILLAISAAITLYFIVDRQHSGQAMVKQDVAPGSNRAALTLADGTTIPLRGDKEGIIMLTNELTYDDGTRILDTSLSAIQYATLATPNGGQYKLTLPDGSRVWLNAASSLTYPTRFDGNERSVELRGEAYFEVERNEKKLFAVVSRGQLVTVLGTQFNINAYENEPVISTTLESGNIRIKHLLTGSVEILQPGQQALISDQSFHIANVDTETYVAWKNGDFLFDATMLDNVLRQLERWYDIEVDYSNIPRDRKLHGIISRGRNLSEVLYMIEKTSGLNFQLTEGRLHLNK